MKASEIGALSVGHVVVFDGAGQRFGPFHYLVTLGVQNRTKSLILKAGQRLVVRRLTLNTDAHLPEVQFREVAAKAVRLASSTVVDASGQAYDSREGHDSKKGLVGLHVEQVVVSGECGAELGRHYAREVQHPILEDF